MRKVFGSPCRLQHAIECVHASVHRLSAQHAFETPADDEHGRAMHQRPHRKHEPRVLPRISSQPFGDTLAHEIEGWPRLVQGRRLRHAIEQHLVGVTVCQSKFQMTLESFAKGSRAAEGGKEFAAGFDAQGPENVVAIAVALVYRGRRGTSRLGHGPHGEGFFAAARPQPRGRAQNTFFQVRVGMPGHFASRTRIELLELRITNNVYYIYSNTDDLASRVPETNLERQSSQYGS